MSAQPYQSDLVQLLEHHGHSPEEIRQIMARLAEYDQAMIRDAVFEGMKSGFFNIGDLLREAQQKASQPKIDGGAPDSPKA